MTDSPTRPELETEAPLEGEPEEPTRGKLLELIAPRNLDWRNLLLVPILAVVTALIIGAIIIALTEGPGEIVSGYEALFRGAFVGWRPISETLTSAAPVILAGLSVAVGFQAGLFNIGGEGQMAVGGLTAVIVGFSFDGLPLLLHLPLAILAGLVGGAIWGGIPGVLRAKTGAHEVITTIMLNFIGLRTLDYVLKLDGVTKPGRVDPISKDVLESARLPRILGWLPVDSASGLRLHLGFLLALAVAAGIWWILYRSTIGFEFRAVGANPHAGRYAGISVARVTISVMALAGALAGLAGANETLGVLGRASPGFTGGTGFDAIALALLGRSHPFGVVLAGLLFGALRAGGRTMQAQSAVGIDLIVVVQALIIVFIAAPALVRAVYRVRTGEGAAQVTHGWSV
jgi:simple sugar transport system permease protein